MSIHGFPKLSIIRNLFRYRHISIDDVSYFYRSWIQDSVFIHAQHDDGSLIRFEASKRGNNVYRNRMITKYNRIREALSSRYNSIFAGFTDIAYITLTYSRQYNLFEAWDFLKKDFMNFITKLKRFLKGSKDYVAVVEAQKDGFPHVHLMFWLPFTTKWFRKGKYLRFNDKSIVDSIKSKWVRGFSDVQASTSPREALGYVFKYFLKGVSFNSNSKDINLPMLWVLRIRALRVSQGISSLYKNRLDSVKRKSAVFIGIEFSNGAFINAFDMNCIKKLINDANFRLHKVFKQTLPIYSDKYLFVGE